MAYEKIIVTGKEGEKIIDLIKFANGLNQNADIDNVIIKMDCYTFRYIYWVISYS